MGTKTNTMQVILIQDVDNLGGANELVTVKNGYARNYLIPQKKAVEANSSNMKQMEERQKQKAKKERNDYENELEKKYKGDADFFKNFEKEVEKCGGGG